MHGCDHSLSRLGAVSPLAKRPSLFRGAQTDPGAAAAETLQNLEWWDRVDYDALGVDVRTVGQIPAELSHSLALLRGAAASAFLVAHDGSNRSFGKECGVAEGHH